MKKFLKCMLVIMMFCCMLPSHTQVDAATMTTVKIKGTYENNKAMKMIEIVNKDRSKIGAQKVVADADLMQTAKQRAAEIAVKYNSDHTRPDGSSFKTVGNKVICEIIQVSTTTNDVSRIMNVWRNSAPHYGVYTDGAYNTVGSACFYHNGFRYWVMHYGINTAKTYTSQPSKQVKTMTVKLSKNDVKLGEPKDTWVYAGDSLNVQLEYYNMGDFWSSYIREDIKVNYYSKDKKVAKIDQNGNIYGIDEGITTIQIRGDINRTFKCEVVKYFDIKYILNGGTLHPYSPKAYYVEATLFPASREGYLFKGWYAGEGYKTKVKTLYWEDFEIFYDDDFNPYTKLYARWTKVEVDQVKAIRLRENNQKLTVKASKVDKADGYQVYIATNKNFKNATKVLLEDDTYQSSTLKKGQIYYVKMRAYRLDSAGKRVYGKFSTVKKIKI